MEGDMEGQMEGGMVGAWEGAPGSKPSWQEGAGLTQRVFDQVPPSPPQDVAAAHPALEPPAPTELPTVYLF